MPANRARAIVLVLCFAAAACASAGSPPRLCARLEGKGPASDAQDSEHRGSAVLVLSRTSVHYRIESTGLGTVVATHIHHGPEGTNGPMLWELNSGYTTDRSEGEASGIPPGVLALIAAEPSDYYVKLHSVRYPGGAIRGQLEPCRNN